ncbi:polysaccharide pyruvyl transferase family protein [Telmatobacter sp. DSM 110680]|uniref:Polysaccharide pyruvyl transferase family protein n=1 Tax=Telmatobacter sp. DSM 110680 TaxID=3036704 RepID=A0AAU7DE51_9BACT
MYRLVSPGENQAAQRIQMIDASALSVRTAPKKLFFIGDNRCSVNWGRGASIALTQLLEKTFEFTGRVTGESFVLGTTDAGYIDTLIPPKHHGLFKYLFQRRWRRPVSWYIRIEEMCGARDFISEDPSVSIDNLMTYKKGHAELTRIYEQAKNADMIVVDGDGDIIFSTPPRRETLFILAMIELGIRLGKPVFLVNSMISDCPLTGRNVATLAAAGRLLAQCKAVSLRDPESLEYVQNAMPQVNCSLIPDSLFLWHSIFQPESSHPPVNGDFLLPHPERDEYWGKLDFSKPYVCIGGGALAATAPDRSVECYSRLVDEVRKLGCQVYLTENDVPDSFLQRVGKAKDVGVVPVDAPILSCGAVLAHARLFISGRYHPSILASLGGTPCIFLGSHAHKMRSLSRVLEYDDQDEFNAFPDESDSKEIVARARKYLDHGAVLRTRISQVAKRRSDEAASLPEFLMRHMDN